MDATTGQRCPVYATPVPSTAKENRGPLAGPENRRAIVAAAREVFGVEGLSAPLSSVARKAGVGQGSLYRHFPDRLSLAVAVFEENLIELEALVSVAHSTLDDLFVGIARQAVASTALIEITAAHRDDQRAEVLATRITAVIAALLERDVSSARVGVHVSVEDVVVAVSMLAFVVARTPESERASTADRARRMFHAAFGATP